MRKHKLNGTVKDFFSCNVILNPDRTDVWEGEDVTLTCTFKTSNQIQAMFWNSTYFTKELAVGVLTTADNDCAVFNNISTISEYSFKCYRNNTFTATWTPIKRRGNDPKWTCRFQGYISTIVTLPIKVPVREVKMMYENTHLSATWQMISVLKETETEIGCNTSYGLPKPNITWYQSDSSNVSKNDLLDTETRYQSSNGDLLSVASTLIFRVKTSNNGDTIFCVATNRQSKEVTSHRLIINVLFPPTISFLQNISIVEGYSLAVFCPVKLGNPPQYSGIWRNDAGNEWDVQHNLTISSVSLDDEKCYSCAVYNTMTPTFKDAVNGTANKEFSLDVLYPPRVPSITLKYQGKDEKELPDVVTVIERSTFTLYCEAKSDPVSSISWTGPKKSLTERLNFEEVRRNESGTYTCMADNYMWSSNDQYIQGINSTRMYLNVLYPPNIPKLTLLNGTIYTQLSSDLLDVFESSSFSVICNTSSNPFPSYSWDSSNETGSSELRIENVTRGRNLTYTCHTWNEMCPSFEQKKDGYNNASLTLRVLYKADNMNFTTTAPHTGINIITSEFDSVQLVCTVDSNPMSNISIKFNDSDVATTTRTNSLVHEITKTNCSHAGVYTCLGRNEYNYGATLHADLILFVKCKPRPSAEVFHNRIITAALHSSVALTFTAANYLEPGKTDFLWMRQRRSLLETLSNNSHTFISVSDLQTSLTIFSVADVDYGEYLLWYNNSVGNNSFIFKVKGEGLTVIQEEIKTSNFAGMAVGIICGIIAVITGFILGIIFYKKRNANGREHLIYRNVLFSGNNIEVKKDNIRMTTFSYLQDIDDVPQLNREPAEYCNSLDVIENIETIKVSELYAYVSGKSEDSFGVHFQKLPTGLQKPCTFARKPENIALNRYNGIYPYDHSRVKLDGKPDFFINACYIDGFNRRNAYIASLGPTKKTMHDFKTFWQMIWNEKSDTVVMLTNLSEPSGMKCEQYWPSKIGAEKWYGDVCVCSQKTDVYAEYTVRTLSIFKDGERRSLTHLHFTAWPDKTVPEDTTSLLEFRHRVEVTPTTSVGPIVVHCSAGIGRTGTLIALDRLIEEGHTNGSVNVFECVNSMREQRVKMVQTLEQYVYIYKALVHALTFEGEAISIDNFRRSVADTNNNMYSRQFQKLRQSVETDSEIQYDSETCAANDRLAGKIREGADIPAARFRVRLYLNGEDGDSDYINAVYINSFKKKDYFILAQSPLPSTVVDFISMVYQEECSCIVALDDLKDSEMEDMKKPNRSFGQYLPNDKHTLIFGHFQVSCSRIEATQQYVVSKMKIKCNGRFNSGEKVVYHFQYLTWMPRKETPADVEEFVMFVNEVEEYASELGDGKSHVLVHCLKANDRSGLFCAVKIIMEKLKYERQVSVLNTLRHLRTRRRSAIPSMPKCIPLMNQKYPSYSKFLGILLRSRISNVSGAA